MLSRVFLHKATKIYIGTLAFIVPSTTITTLFSTNYDNKDTNILKQSIYNVGYGFIIGSLYPISFPYLAGKKLGYYFIRN